MKKYIIKILMFVLPILFLAVIIEMSVRAIPNNYKFKKNFLNTHSNEINTLVLGHSQTLNGIDPKYFSNKCYNAAFSAQSLKYDLKVLEKHKDNLKNMKYLIIPVSYFSLYYQLETGISSYLVKNYELYLEVNKIQKFRDKYEILSININDNIKRLKSYYIKKKNPISCDENGWEVNKKSSDLEKTGIKALGRHNEYIEYGRVNHLADNVSYLNNIIEICDDLGAQVIFITPPSFRSYTDNINKEYLNETLTILNGLSESNQNCSYINLFQDSIFIESDYSDVNHLNKFGAKKFSILIDKYIMELGKDPK